MTIRGLKIGFKEPSFMSCQVRLHTTFLQVVVEVMAFNLSHVLKDIVRGKQGHTACKKIGLANLLF